MEELRIAFDLNGFQEYFIKYKILEYKGKLAKKKKDKFYIFERQKPSPETLGTFLLAFLNTNFEDKDACKEFIFEYLYVNLLLRINKDIYLNSDIHGEAVLPMDITKIKFDIILSEEEINYYYDKMYSKFKNELLYYQKTYIAVSELKYFELSAVGTKGKIKSALLKAAKDETYYTSLSNLSASTFNLHINFDLLYFYTLKNKSFIIENIPYSFSSNKFYDILFITFREFANKKKKILVQKCENCGKYFIPSTAHDTKYCDSLFDGEKTCKQIGIEKAYLLKLDKDPLLKKYRTRYQTLSKGASTAKKNSEVAKMYAFYKKEGPKQAKAYKEGKLSKEEFEKWIDETKLNTSKSK